MSQPVKVSDELLLDARLAGKAAERSIAGQIEYWARLGRAVELHLRAAEALRLKRQGDARPLSQLLSSIGTLPGRKRLGAYLGSRPFPHFEPAPGKRGLLVKIDEDGTRSVGRFFNREFRPSK
jgi:ParD-like antitoxin of type II bacterial toxin-antitoxin system